MTTVDASAPPRQPWLAATISAAAGTLLLLAVFWQTAWTAVETWETSLYGHGYLIIPIVGFLIWRQRSALSEVVPQANLWGLPVLIGAVLVWLVGDAAGVMLIKQFALVAMVQALVFTVLGTRATRIIVYPLLYLFFCVPFGGFMIAPLQEFTAEFTVKFLQFTGIPVFLDGLLIDIPSGRFHVAEACSGARFLISSTALGFLVAHIFYRDIWRRVLFIAISLAVPIVANGLRAYGIVMLAHLSDYEIAAGADHVIYGLIFLTIVIFLILAIGTAFRERDRDGLLVPPLAVAPDKRGGPPRSLVSLAVALVIAAGVVAGVRSYAASVTPEQPPVVMPDLAAAVTADIWQGAASVDWQPDMPTADATAALSFNHGATRATLFVAYFATQRQGAEASVDLTSASATDNSTVVESGRRTVRLGEIPIEVRHVRLRKGLGGRLVWYWYWVDGGFTASRGEAKLREVRAKLMGGERAAALIAISARYVDQPEEAEEVLRRFAESLEPLGEMLTQTGGGLTDIISSLENDRVWHRRDL
jgi:exosortase A